MASPHPAMHLRYAIANAPLQSYPFPHMHVRNVFPADFYATLLDRMPARERFARAGGDSGERLTLPMDAATLGNLEEPCRGFWTDIAGWLLADDFLEFLLDIFEPVMPQRSKAGLEGYRREARLVRDSARPREEPTAGPAEIALSMLFQLPRDDSLAHLGAGMYVPEANGTPACACTMPFLPNSLFAFVRTPASFHAFGAVSPHEARDMLRYDLRLQA